MPRIEVNVKITPDEFRDALPPPLRDLFDFMVAHLVHATSFSEEEAKTLVAHEMLEAFKSMRGER